MSAKTRRKKARRKNAVEPFTRVEQEAYDAGLTVRRGSLTFTKKPLTVSNEVKKPQTDMLGTGAAVVMDAAKKRAEDRAKAKGKPAPGWVKKQKETQARLAKAESLGVGKVTAVKKPAKPKRLSGLPLPTEVYTLADVLQMDLTIDGFTGKVTGDINVIFDAEVYGLTRALVMQVVKSALWPKDKLIGVVLELKGQDALSAFGLLALYDWVNKTTVLVAVPLIKFLELWDKKPPLNAQKMIRLAVEAGYMRAWKLQSEKTKWERIGSL